jgi:repressor LexA
MNKEYFKKIGERIKQSRLDAKLSLEEVGKPLGYHKTTIMRWEKGQTEKIGLPSIQMLSNIFSKDIEQSINPVWLMGYDVPKFIPKVDTKSIKIPILGRIPAGIAVEMVEDILDFEDISGEMLKGNKEYFGLKVNGDSMYPEYLDGDVIIVLKISDCESGDDAIISVNGNDATFKRVFKSDNGIILQPLNNAYSPINYTNKDIETIPIKILGIVVELRRNKKR